jgi:hypothetical protein
MAVVFVPESALDDAVEGEDGVDLGEDSYVAAELMLAGLEVREVLCDAADVSEADTAIVC